MFIPGGSAIETGGYNINNSLRFRSSASAYLSRTPASAGSRTTWTWSAWVKRGALGSPTKELFTASSGGEIFFGTSDTLTIYDNATTYLTTTQVFRDPSAWYHLVVVWDTTQATAANRIKIYVNGSQVTAFTTATYPAQNTTSSFNNNTLHNIGEYFGGGSYYYDGYMTEINFIDGQALTPSSFGATDAITGVWAPAAYTGSYGTNGFYLKFSDIATTSGSNAGLGKDFSGNGNYWTTNNISVTAGTTYDAMTDSPTLTSSTVANYAVMNPVGVWKTAAGGLATFAGANLNVSGGAGWYYAYSSIAVPIGSGQYYAEFTINTSGGSDFIAVGINPVVASLSGGSSHSSSEGGVWYSNNATKWVGSTNSAYGASYTAGDIIGVAVDSGASTITFYKNNTSQGSISFNSNLTSNTFALLGVDMYNSSISANFGQRPFSYTPPTGFNRLNAFNLPNSTVVKGNTVMDATLYTGNGTSGKIVTNSAGFKPDFVWIKDRSAPLSHGLFDSVRGAGYYLISNSTAAQSSFDAQSLQSFNSNGFTVGSTGDYNSNNNPLVGWQWQAGQGSTSSNTAGSITSTVSVNTTAGFSVATYTGNGSAGATIGHGLGVAPKFIIIKKRSSTADWDVYHSSLGATKALYLNRTDGQQTDTTFWNDTAPSSTLTTFGTSPDINSNGVTYVMYSWAEIAGFSKFGSYTGNGSADGAFVYTGFRPKFIIIKQSSAAGENWVMYDTVRNTYNVANLLLHPNLSNAESTTTLNPIDILSNGFKLRGSSGLTNTSSATYIYAAFAENPFKNALAR